MSEQTRAAPLVIAHRGASGERPEHTLAAYDLAIRMGSDFVEPDLVFTRDGQLICRHDVVLGATTDVADRPEFSNRQRPGADGAGGPDWFVHDFTLAELRTLRARQSRAGRSRVWDGEFRIPTFDEMLELVAERSRASGHPVGVYPETKHPEAFAARGQRFEEPLLAALARHGFGVGGLPVFIQAFHPAILRRLAERTDIPLVQLLDRDWSEHEEPSLETIADYASLIGPHKDLLISRGAGDEAGTDTGLAERARGHGLDVHAWTFRADAPGPGFATYEDELRAFSALGIGGLFTDHPDRTLAFLGRVPG